MLAFHHIASSPLGSLFKEALVNNRVRNHLKRSPWQHQIAGTSSSTQCYPIPQRRNPFIFQKSIGDVFGVQLLVAIISPLGIQRSCGVASLFLVEFTIIGDPALPRLMGAGRWKYRLHSACNRNRKYIYKKAPSTAFPNQSLQHLNPSRLQIPKFHSFRMHFQKFILTAMILPLAIAAPIAVSPPSTFAPLYKY